jgi:hypothetical protein
VVSIVQIVDGLEIPSVTFAGEATFGQSDATNFNLCIAQGQSFCGYFDPVSKNVTIYSDSDFDSSNAKQFIIRATFFGNDSSLSSRIAKTEAKLNLIQSSEASDFYSIVSKVDFVYYIGLTNSPIDLKSLYDWPNGQRITSIIPI